MKDILVELLDAKNRKIFKDNEFGDLLQNLGRSCEGSTIDWDNGAGEEWAFVNNDDFSVMLNRRIGICFVHGRLSEAAVSLLSRCKCVSVDGFDINEWCVDLTDLRNGIPEIAWHASANAVDPGCFSLNEFYYATV